MKKKLIVAITKLIETVMSEKNANTEKYVLKLITEESVNRF